MKSDSIGGNGGYDGHEGSNGPTSVDGVPFTSPATFVSLAETATSVNSKRPEGVKSK